MYVASWNETHYWRFEPGGCAELGPSEGCDPPTLFLARSAGSEDWITLIPPTSLDDFPAFDKFLGDLVEAANGLRLKCQPDGDWGRRVSAEAAGNPDGGDRDGLGDAGAGCFAARRGGSVAGACLDGVDLCRCGR